MFGESSSEDEDDECRSCRGHKDKCFRDDKDSQGQGGKSCAYLHIEIFTLLVFSATINIRKISTSNFR